MLSIICYKLSWSHTPHFFCWICSYLIILNLDLSVLPLPVTCICSAPCQQSGFVWIISLSLPLPWCHTTCSSTSYVGWKTFIFQVSSSVLHLQIFNSMGFFIIFLQHSSRIYVNAPQIYICMPATTVLIFLNFLPRSLYLGVSLIFLFNYLPSTCLPCSD